ncbi:dTDP-4-dehydrorhamnose 3,5-epimerase [Maribacter antarcticus]|uniref:dTDP-4-dehydrorhamnose 3,5-epimerase n=1 Tax=Maribacter antarcticus TaxID=505250 RepID=UPI00047A71A0|nr:dTDP-4-dehydrorhamnose 3,5-epimerase [Maribacter antarcticus]
MKAEATMIEGCYVLEPNIFEDKRGYFFESFNQQKFEDIIGTAINFIQDNQSKSSKGVLRGLHYQKGTFAQAKLVRVLEGEVLDVVVDLRKDKTTYKNVFVTTLSQKNNKQLFIPRGCAHGFLTLSDSATFFYKCDNLYHKEAEAGIRYDDPEFAIDWKLPDSELIISEKDILLPFFNQTEKTAL